MALTQISTGGIKDDAVTDAKLPANSVGNSEMKDDAVDSAEIADGAVDLVHLSASGTASSSTFLRGDNTWATPPDTDTNTQLSTEQVQDIVGAMFTGNTETNITVTYEDSDGTIDLVATGASVGGSTGVDFNDDVKARFGTGNDLEIYHNGTNSKITNSTGTLYLEGTTEIWNSAGSEAIAKFTTDGAVELYHNNVKRFSTVANGCNIIGNSYHIDSEKSIYGTGDDLQIYHDGSHSRITAINGGTGRLIISGRDSGTAGDIGLQLNADVSEEAIICRVDQGVELYYNGSKTFETLEYGAKIKRPSGGETDLEIFGCEGQGANILLAADDGDDNPDKWRFRSSIYGSGHWQFYDGSSWDDAIKVVNGEGVHLHYNGNEKLATTSGGVQVTGNMVADAFYLGDNEKLYCGTGDDLTIWHDGSNSYIKNSTNALTIQGNAVYINDVPNGKTSASFDTDGGVALYYNNTVIAQTKSASAIVSSSSYTGGFSSSSGSTPVGLSLSVTGATNQQVSCNSSGYEVNVVNNISGSGHDACVHQYRTLNGTEGSLLGSSSGLSISNNSDYRKKERITDLTGSLEVIDSLRPRQYYYRAGFGKPTRAFAGFIAHELQSTDLPHLTTGVKDAVVTDENKNNGLYSELSVGDPIYQTVAYSDNELITHLVNAIKELKAKVTALEST